MEALTFWIFSTGLVVSAMGVLLSRNPVTSALCLATAFVFLAAIFVTLEAFFLAMVQIIVYAGAVMVLFLFIIMLLDIREENKAPFPRLRLPLIAMVMVGAGYMFLKIIQTIPHGGEVLEWGKSGVDASAGSVGKVLFSEYLLPFEIIGVLLLMATVGVVILSQSRETKD